MSDVIGIDWFDSILPITFSHGNGKKNTLSKEHFKDGHNFSGTVLLPNLPQQKVTMVDYSQPRRWNSGFDTNSKNNYARVPAWALLEAFKQKTIQPHWGYSRPDGQASASCRDMAEVLHRESLNHMPSNYDMTVMAIPETTSSWGQENLLRSYPEGRNKLRLLWRSVAAVLGLPEDQYSLFKERKRLAVFDFQHHRLDITILELRRDNEGGVTMLVPVRHLPQHDYFQTTELPPLALFYAEELLASLGLDYDERSVWQLAMVNGLAHMGDKRTLQVPLRNGRWDEIVNSNSKTMHSIKLRADPCWHHISTNLIRLAGGDSKPYHQGLTPSQAHQFILQLKNDNQFNFDYALLCGPYLPFLEHERLKKDIPCKTVWRESFDTKDNLISIGCGVFGLRAINGLPTYFDQLPQLEIVVQDIEEEDIRTDTLIRGGVVKGNIEFKLEKPLTGYYLEKGNTFCDFYLQMEQETKLRELVQDFDVKLGHRAELELHPRMRPAQGMAIVEVHNPNIFSEPVLLDWEKMTETNETIADLRKKINRSFPPYIPGVKASNEKWDFNKCEYHIRQYSQKGIGVGDVAKILGGIGMDHKDETGLGRVNVFGNAKDYHIPSGASKDLIQLFFNRLLRDYDKKCYYPDVIRVIAWTYDNKVFANVRKDLLAKLDSGAGLMRQEQTGCANLFCTPREYKAYFKCVLIEFEASNGQNMNDYVNCLKKLLSYRNETLDHIDTESCYKMMEYLLKMLIEGFNQNKPLIFKNALTTMLFMLKRRRFDRSFMPYTEKNKLDPLLNTIIRKIEEVIRKCENDMFRRNLVMTIDGQTNLAEEILKFMKGKGRLDGIPGAL